MMAMGLKEALQADKYALDAVRLQRYTGMFHHIHQIFNVFTWLF